jgi:hypothetical protein
MKIKIPFNAWSQERMRSGKKTMTSRTKKYGKPGDTFEAGGQRYRLTELYRFPLNQVAMTCFKDEGCESPREFQKVWESIHPRKGWVPEQVVWVHEFTPADILNVTESGDKSTTSNSDKSSPNKL